MPVHLRFTTVSAGQRDVITMSMSKTGTTTTTKTRSGDLLKRSMMTWTQGDLANSYGPSFGVRGPSSGVRGQIFISDPTTTPTTEESCDASRGEGALDADSC